MSTTQNNGVPENPSKKERPTGTPAATPQEMKLDVQNAERKTWFSEYVYNKERPVLGTLWNLLTMKPVEGVVNAVTFNKIPLVGKLARFAAIAAGVYFGIGALKSGAEVAFQGGNTLLDRMGPGGGKLFPPMELPPASPYQQVLPQFNPLQGA